MKKLEQGDDQIKMLRDILEQAKRDKETRGDGPISIDLFAKIGKLKLCQPTFDQLDKFSYCINIHIAKRSVAEQMRAKGGKQGYNRQKTGGHSHGGKKGDDEDYQRGGGNRQGGYNRHNNWNNQADIGGSWKMEDTAEKAKLKEKAKAMYEKVNQDKNEEQKIRLILNVITPENYDKKFTELRGFLFGNRKTEEECREDGEKYDESQKLTDDTIRKDILRIIVQNIFRKAQVEKEYCIFYGDICERLIKLELSLRGLENKIKDMKQSNFRIQLFEVCKECFEKFFDVEETAKANSDLEKQLLFRTKLFGNLDFVGELYRRKMLPETVLKSVFTSLLGMSELNNKVSDLNVEGATRLMNKVGETFEQRSSNKKKAPGDSESFIQILNKFEEIMNLPDESDQITKRIKLLIKNMFTNKESGWAKTKDLNEGGPKTK